MNSSPASNNFHGAAEAAVPRRTTGKSKMPSSSSVNAAACLDGGKGRAHRQKFSVHNSHFSAARLHSGKRHLAAPTRMRRAARSTPARDGIGAAGGSSYKLPPPEISPATAHLRSEFTDKLGILEYASCHWEWRNESRKQTNPETATMFKSRAAQARVYRVNFLPNCIKGFLTNLCSSQAASIMAGKPAASKVPKAAGRVMSG